MGYDSTIALSRVFDKQRQAIATSESEYKYWRKKRTVGNREAAQIQPTAYEIDAADLRND